MITDSTIVSNGEVLQELIADDETYDIITITEYGNWTQVYAFPNQDEDSTFGTITVNDNVVNITYEDNLTSFPATISITGSDLTMIFSESIDDYTISRTVLYRKKS